MALVADGFNLSVTLADRGGNTTVKSFDLTSADHATALTDATAILAALTGVSDASVKGYTIGTRYVENAFVLPTVGEIENQAMLTFRLYGDPLKKATFTIPAPKDAIFSASSGALYNQVDLADTEVIAMRNVFFTGGEATISDGETAVALENGKRIHRKSRRG